MKNKENNYAFIDGANLHKGIKELGWQLDYKRFRIFLFEKYAVNKVYIFLGFIPTNANLYRDLQNWGYVVLSPNHKKASILLRKAVPESIVFLDRFRDRLAYGKQIKDSIK